MTSRTGRPRFIDSAQIFDCAVLRMRGFRNWRGSIRGAKRDSDKRQNSE